MKYSSGQTANIFYDAWFHFATEENSEKIVVMMAFACWLCPLYEAMGGWVVYLISSLAFQVSLSPLF